MSEQKWLTNDSLSYIWTKIKGILPKKTSELINDSGFITGADIPEGAAASTTTPKMAGTANVGSEMAFARGDHVHPSDSTKVDKITGKGLSTNDLTVALKQNYDAAYSHSQALHAPTSAEKNIIVGIQRNGTDLNVDSQTRKVNVNVPTKVSELTNDAGFITVDEVPETYVLPTATDTILGGVKIGSNIKISGGVISVNSGSTTVEGLVQLSDSVSSTSTTLAATPSAVKQAYDLAKGKQSPATTLAGYGITDAYTKTEIDGKLTGTFHYMGTKAYYADLPASGNTKGDVWNITNATPELNINAGDNVAWNGSAWDVLSGVVDLSAYVLASDVITNAEIDQICV